MSIEIDAEKFAFSVVSSTPAIGDSPEAVAKDKLEHYLAAYKVAETHNSSLPKKKPVPLKFSGVNRTRN